MNDHAPPQYEEKDDVHYDALAGTGFFGEQASGCVLMAKNTGRILLVLRSPAVLESNTWGNIGGAHGAEEAPRDAAKREVYEETGYSGNMTIRPLLVFKKETFRYSNFLAIIETEFEPSLGWEATDYRWCELDNLPSNLHFGMTALFSDKESWQTLSHYSDLFSK